MGVIGLIDCLRSITIETIEVIKTWQESQVTYPEVKDFIWVLEHLLLTSFSLLTHTHSFPQLGWT